MMNWSKLYLGLRSNAPRPGTSASGSAGGRPRRDRARPAKATLTLRAQRRLARSARASAPKRSGDPRGGSVAGGACRRSTLAVPRCGLERGEPDLVGRLVRPPARARRGPGARQDWTRVARAAPSGSFWKSVRGTIRKGRTAASERANISAASQPPERLRRGVGAKREKKPRGAHRAACRPPRGVPAGDGPVRAYTGRASGSSER